MGSFRTRVEEGMIGGKRKGVGQETAHVPEDLVWLVAQLEVEPAQLLVVPADDEVVAERVDVHARDPSDAGLERLEQLLLGKVVYSHEALGLSLQSGDVRKKMKMRDVPRQRSAALWDGRAPLGPRP